MHVKKGMKLIITMVSKMERTQIVLNIVHAVLMAVLVLFVLQIRGLIGDVRKGALQSINQTLLQLNQLLPHLTETITDVNQMLPDVVHIVKQVRVDMDKIQETIDEVEEMEEEANSMWDWLT
jgi:methyl-accepting chemotaxis protein